MSDHVTHAFDRLVAANPVPDPRAELAGLFELTATVGREADAVMAASRPLRSPSVRPVGRRSVAFAVFAMVLVVGVALGLSISRGRPVSVSSRPLDVVTAFFERWNAGDVDGAWALVDPDLSVSGTQPGDLRGLIEWTLGFDGTMEANCEPGSTAGRVVCDWAWRTAATEALGMESFAGRTFVVDDGIIVTVTTPNYAAVERPLITLARETDPDGFAAACAPDGESPVSFLGIPYNGRCGRFLAGYESAFVAGLD